MRNTPKLTEEEFYGIDDLKGWMYMEGTESRRAKPWGVLVTRVYDYRGRFFSVAVGRTQAGGPAFVYDGTIVEVYPHRESMTVYRTSVRADTADLYDAIGVNKVGAILILRALNDDGATLGDVVSDIEEAHRLERVPGG